MMKNLLFIIACLAILGIYKTEASTSTSQEVLMSGYSTTNTHIDTPHYSHNEENWRMVNVSFGALDSETVQ